MTLMHGSAERFDLAAWGLMRTNVPKAVFLHVTYHAPRPSHVAAKPKAAKVVKPKAAPKAKKAAAPKK